MNSRDKYNARYGKVRAFSRTVQRWSSISDSDTLSINYFTSMFIPSLSFTFLLSKRHSLVIDPYCPFLVSNRYFYLTLVKGCKNQPFCISSGFQFISVIQSVTKWKFLLYCVSVIHYIIPTLIWSDEVLFYDTISVIIIWHSSDCCSSTGSSYTQYGSYWYPHAQSPDWQKDSQGAKTQTSCHTSCDRHRQR